MKEEILAMEAGEELDELVATQIKGEPKPDYVVENALDLQLAGNPAKSLGGNWLFLCEYDKGDIPTWYSLPFSTDISVAWQVVDKMFELGYAMSLFEEGYARSLLYLSSKSHPKRWYCNFRPKDSNKPPENEWGDHQMTAPVAICKAALLTRLEGAR